MLFFFFPGWVNSITRAFINCTKSWGFSIPCFNPWQRITSILWIKDRAASCRNTQSTGKNQVCNFRFVKKIFIASMALFEPPFLDAILKDVNQLNNRLSFTLMDNLRLESPVKGLRSTKRKAFRILLYLFWNFQEEGGLWCSILLRIKSCSMPESRIRSISMRVSRYSLYSLGPHFRLPQGVLDEEAVEMWWFFCFLFFSCQLKT